MATGGSANIQHHVSEKEEEIKKYSQYLITGNSTMIDQAMQYFDGVFLLALVADASLEKHVHTWREAFKTGLKRQHVPSPKQKLEMLRRIVLHSPKNIALDVVCTYLQCHKNEEKEVMRMLKCIPEVYESNRVWALLSFVPESLIGR